ncbi:zinc finger protein, putative [Plasmodium malariae]|uniref:Zinc finger protein, putative n=1 Tax=Plasmodium malariae TaxID=5858 RepID=A0A1A8WC83_PLAMA|nr:zinc finger protein, putative [Plasmodium malariae]SBS89627.1 zinc finger protein, putative [Plasmodium malariae]SCP02739.1 zinc finger protein, putative [Plasmodium malariae]
MTQNLLKRVLNKPYMSKSLPIKGNKFDGKFVFSTFKNKYNCNINWGCSYFHRNVVRPFENYHPYIFFLKKQFVTNNKGENSHNNKNDNDITSLSECERNIEKKKIIINREEQNIVELQNTTKANVSQIDHHDKEKQNDPIVVPVNDDNHHLVNSEMIKLKGNEINNGHLSVEEGKTRKDKEYMVIMFTCKICEKKTAKKFSKQAYYNGVVIIRCPSCENLHLISDQLGWFQDGKTNIEKILQEKGEKVIKKFSYNNLLEIDDLLNAYK